MEGEHFITGFTGLKGRKALDKFVGIACEILRTFRRCSSKSRACILMRSKPSRVVAVRDECKR